MGTLPEKLVTPNNRLATALPSPGPGYHASPRQSLLSHGIRTGIRHPVSTTMVRGLACDCEDQGILMLRRRFAGSEGIGDLPFKGDIADHDDRHIGGRCEGNGACEVRAVIEGHGSARSQCAERVLQSLERRDRIRRIDGNETAGPRGRRISQRRRRFAARSAR